MLLSHVMIMVDRWKNLTTKDRVFLLSVTPQLKEPQGKESRRKEIMWQCSKGHKISAAMCRRADFSITSQKKKSHAVWINDRNRIIQTEQFY